LVLEYLSAAEGEDEEGEYGGVLFDFRAPLVGDLCRPLGRVSITYVEQYTALHPGAMVVSANQVISFGRSATQEELYFGCAHETCPAVLFVPRLGDSALIISPVTSNLRIEGARRSTSWFRARSSGHTFLLMDALEMDEVEGGVRANLDPANMDREIAKAYTTFSGAADLSVHRVATPAWGCGAFCGVPGVKVPLLRSAAASAGVDLEVVVDPPHHLVAREFEAFTRRWSGSARELRERLGGVPADLVGVDVLAAL
jgi:poly(ADP-ribose) glycohydrolase